MHVPAPTKKFFFREPPNIIFPTPTHVPMAMDVPTDGSQYVSTPVEQSNKKQQPVKRLGKSKQKLKPTRRGRGGRKKGGNGKIQTFSILGTNANGLKAKKNSLVNTLNFFNNPSVLGKQTQTKWNYQT